MTTADANSRPRPGAAGTLASHAPPHAPAVRTADCVPRTARERARIEITAEILNAGRAHLAREGAAALSLRAVARELGMVSSAVYRYVPSRDALLTMLIIDAYDAVGAAVETAEAGIPRPDHLGRFLETCRALRAWARANPHEYALIYGSPVPGYAAPEATIGPATRVPAVLLRIISDLIESGSQSQPAPVAGAVRASIAPFIDFTAGRIPEDLLLRALASWASILGTISLELFGHLHNVVSEDPEERAAFFEHQMRQVAAGLGLAGP